ncbi:MAG: branched-chain amino acid ABC transporter substrate-binding protein, partial [Hyphomicrobiales bacterium]|nr:branched-chain amino acid ABC transporter substrate-binding protein [Hyphomicrobiales bacterium]
RFFKRYKRRMRAKDYQVWAPIRAIGEAATRANSADFAKMVGYLKSKDFELAGFKGVPLTFRDWNWQLRQPILLIQPSALVSVSPQEGFLHSVSVLDTMGQDKRETTCKLN